MTKKEIAEIIKAKATDYGFEMESGHYVWGTKQTNESNVRIDIVEEQNESKSDFKNGMVWLDIKAQGCICRMGGHHTPEVLAKAAEEIARGAKFAEEINQMELSYVENF